MLAPGLALIFDMDGVLLDSNPAHRESWEAYNRSFGLETTEAMHGRMYGKRNDEIIRDFYGRELLLEEVMRRGADKERLYREMIAGKVEQMLVPGLRSFLGRYEGAPLALASNAEPDNVAFLLDQAGLRTFFQVIVDGHQVQHPKPDPEIYLRTASLLGVEPANAIVFEDSYTGVEAARAAGMKIVGICTTHVNLPGAELCVDNFLDGGLHQWLAAQGRTV